MDLGLTPPPMAGTDLPNNPYRDPWQPFLGGMRLYAKTGGETGSRAWNAAVRRGEVFATSGPAIDLRVNGVGMGGVVRLPAGGGEVEVEAELKSPRKLTRLELVRNSEVAEASTASSDSAGVHRIRLAKKIRIERSSWIAARGVGGPIEAISQTEVAHTAAIRVLVGEQPILVEASERKVRESLAEQRVFYRDNGVYPNEARRQRMLDQLDQALARLP
jgi:hypothetical protein